MKGRRILIVEGEWIVAEDLREILKKEGYQVEDVARSSEEAIEKAQQIQPDIILMDVHLHARDGSSTSELLRTLRESEMRVVFMGATSAEMSAWVRIGCVVLNKPFTDRDVVKALSDLHRSSFSMELSEN